MSSSSGANNGYVEKIRADIQATRKDIEVFSANSSGSQGKRALENRLNGIIERWHKLLGEEDKLALSPEMRSLVDFAKSKGLSFSPYPPSSQTLSSSVYKTIVRKKEVSEIETYAERSRNIENAKELLRSCKQQAGNKLDFLQKEQRRAENTDLQIFIEVDIFRTHELLMQIDRIEPMIDTLNNEEITHVMDSIQSQRQERSFFAQILHFEDRLKLLPPGLSRESSEVCYDLMAGCRDVLYDSSLEEYPEAHAAFLKHALAILQKIAEKTIPPQHALVKKMGQELNTVLEESARRKEPGLLRKYICRYHAVLSSNLGFLEEKMSLSLKEEERLIKALQSPNPRKQVERFLKEVKHSSYVEEWAMAALLKVEEGNYASLDQLRHKLSSLREEKRLDLLSQLVHLKTEGVTPQRVRNLMIMWKSLPYEEREHPVVMGAMKQIYLALQKESIKDLRYTLSSYDRFSLQRAFVKLDQLERTLVKNPVLQRIDSYEKNFQAKMEYLNRCKARASEGSELAKLIEEAEIEIYCTWQDVLETKDTFLMHPKGDYSRQLANLGKQIVFIDEVLKKVDEKLLEVTGGESLITGGRALQPLEDFTVLVKDSPREDLADKRSDERRDHVSQENQARVLYNANKQTAESSARISEKQKDAIVETRKFYHRKDRKEKVERDLQKKEEALAEQRILFEQKLEAFMKLAMQDETVLTATKQKSLEALFREMEKAALLLNPGNQKLCAEIRSLMLKKEFQLADLMDSLDPLALACCA